MLALFILFVALVLFIRSPWGQHIIVSKTTAYISEKTNTKVEIEKLYLTFSGNLLLKGLYLEDQQGDTLVYSKSLEASIALMPLIRGTAFNLKSLKSDGLKASISRKDSISSFNYSFLIDAFATENTPPTAPKESLKITLGAMDFKNIAVSYGDDVLGMKSHLRLKQLHVQTNSIDLEQMIFDVQTLSLSEGNIAYQQTKPFSSNPTEEKTKLPFISIQNFQIDKTSLTYSSTPDDLEVQLDLHQYQLTQAQLDAEKQQLNFDTFSLQNSSLSYLTSASKNNDSITTPTNFQWPEWTISAKNIAISTTKITAITGNTASKINVFNNENIAINKLSFKANSLDYSPAYAGLILEEVSFIERSGFELKNLSAQLQLNNTSTSAKEFSIQTNTSQLTGEILLEYPNINELIKHPEQSQLSLRIPHLSVNPNDTYYFSPTLMKNEYLNALSQKQLTGYITANGSLNNLIIRNTNLQWGDETVVDIAGVLKNVDRPNNIFVDLTNFTVASNKADLQKFIKPAQTSIEFPKTFKLSGRIKGGADNFDTAATLSSSEGIITVKGNFKNTESIAFNGDLDVKNLRVGKLLKNEKLGTYSFSSQLTGQGNSLNTLNASLRTDFKKLSYNTYDLSALQLSGNIVRGNGTLSASFKDENIDFTLENKLQLDTVSSIIHSSLALNGINFQALGLTDDDVRMKFLLEAKIEGNSGKNFQLNGQITDAMSVRNNKPYLLGNINFKGQFMEQGTNFSIESNPLTASLVLNTDVASLISAIEKQLNTYFESPLESVQDTVASHLTMTFHATVKQAPILKDLFLPQLESLEPLTLEVDFNEDTKVLNAKATAPHIAYSGSTLDSLDFTLTGTKDSFGVNFDLGSLTTGALAIQRLAFTGNLKDQVFYSNFKALNKGETLVKIATETSKENDSIVVHINPEGLILNQERWSILEDNSLTLATNFIGFKHMTLSQNEQQITLRNSVDGTQKDQLDFDFKNFELSTITSIFNSEKLVASGKLNGELSIERPFGDTGILANATVTDLHVIEVPFGTLALNATSADGSTYELGVGITGKNLNVDISGDYIADIKGAQLNFDVNLKNLELKPVEQLMGAYISQTSGQLSGDLKLTGTTVAPKFVGALQFNEAGLTINAFNASFLLPDESIKLDEKGLYFNSFTLLDSRDNPLSIDGNILTKNLLNPSFNLRISATNIEVLNSTKEDNELFYGKVNLDTDVTIEGSLALPKVRGSLMINDSSNFTYVIPEEEVDIIEKEGVVIFVNKKNPNDILTRHKEDLSSTAVLKGYDIVSQLSVSKDAQFNIIVDERSGDNLNVSGTGDFTFGVSENGDMSLSGKYEVEDGHYEVNLYNLVKRHFDIERGSSILWRGNPLEADLDIRAIYNVEAAASGLMATQLTGESKSVLSKYRQKLPFLVYLNLKGQLLQPELTFNLDIPKDEQGELGGAVYAQVQQLNTQPDLLNKQVFSLLVLNQFFPSTTNDGSSGGSLSIARDNANNVLSNQLNNYSNRLFGASGIELDFDLDSYTDYQGDTPTNKTQLEVNARKRLLNDRLTIEVGSGVDIQENSQNTGQTTPLVGTVNIQYQFDEMGKWKLKAYRKNDFENVIDGQVILSGISLLFSQEFNKFEELFKKAVKEDTVKSNAKKTLKKDKKSK